MWDTMPTKMADYLETYIEGIPEDEKAENSLIEERLACCKTCKHFQEGICRACGCYVSLRAAVKRQKCPYKKWNK